MNVLFVGFENVCRTSMAEALLKKKFENEGIEGEVDSAGFESFFINDPPNEHAVRVGKIYGYDVKGKMRLFLKEDFDKFDKIYVMDTKNYNDVIYLAKIRERKQKVDYLMNLMEPGKNISITNPLDSGLEDCHNTFKKLDKVTDKLVELVKTGKL